MTKDKMITDVGSYKVFSGPSGREDGTWCTMVIRKKKLVMNREWSGTQENEEAGRAFHNEVVEKIRRVVS